MKTKLKRFFKNLYEILSRPEMTVLPGQQAFFFILSLVPTITIIFYIASFLHISIADISNYFNMNLSPTIMNLLTPAVENTTLNSGLIIVLIVGITKKNKSYHNGFHNHFAIPIHFVSTNIWKLFTEFNRKSNWL